MTEPLGALLLDQLLAGAGEPAGTAAPVRLSVIGLSKNAGKTVTLNHLIRAASARGLSLGLISTGRDGEQQDAITELPKPRIWAPAGAWLATARSALEAATCSLTIFRDLPFQTPFGSVVVARVEREGDVLLIGPGSARRISEALGALEAYGARFCLVDGSFDRVAAAGPTVTGQVVLAAGAAFSSNLKETVAQVQHVLSVFDLPPVPAAIERAVELAAERGPVSVVTLAGSITDVLVPSALGDPEVITRAVRAMQPFGTYLVLNGALGDRLLMSLIRHRVRGVGLVVNDPTHVLVERNLWRRWRRQFGEVYVRWPVSLRAITLNPASPVGAGYDPDAFFQAVSAVAGRPVFDLEAGLQYEKP